MTTGHGLLERLQRWGLLSPGEEVSFATPVDVPGVDGALVESPGWCSFESGRAFNFWFESIAQHQMDDGLLDVIAPSVAALGLELTHDWNVGSQHDDQYRDDTGLRIWINGEPVTFPAPHGVNCMRPLELVNWLMRRAGIDEQFYFACTQWMGGAHPSFYFEQVDVVLLTDEMFEFLSTTDEIGVEESRPVRLSDVVGTVESWVVR